MSMDIRASVLAVVPLLGLVGCTEEIDPVLQGPMGLVWLESQESLYDRGLIGNMEEFFEARGQEVDWEESPFAKGEPSCFNETDCFSHQEKLLGDRFDRATLIFDQNRLISADFSYRVSWDAESQSIDLDRVEQLYQSLYSQLSIEYGQGSDHGEIATFRERPVNIIMTLYTPENEDLESSIGIVGLEYYFDIEEYNEILDQ